MKLKLIEVVVLGLCLLIYLYKWYIDEPVPAWQAAIWLAAIFVNQLNDYLEEKNWS
jgi:hypothetical protein